MYCLFPENTYGQNETIKPKDHPSDRGVWTKILGSKHPQIMGMFRSTSSFAAQTRLYTLWSGSIYWITVKFETTRQIINTSILVLNLRTTLQRITNRSSTNLNRCSTMEVSLQLANLHQLRMWPKCHNYISPSHCGWVQSFLTCLVKTPFEANGRFSWVRLAGSSPLRGAIHVLEVLDIQLDWISKLSSDCRLLIQQPREALL